MPRVGMRMVKTAIAVFLCLLIDFLRNAALPIFAPLAAILCMQKDAHESFKIAVHRVIGTIIGGAYGLGVLFLFETVLGSAHILLQYVLIAAFLIPLIYLTVLIKESSATYISCVLYCVIVIPIGGDLPPYLIAMHRTLDTIIGILVSLAVNICICPIRKDEFIEIISERIHPLKGGKELSKKDDV